MEMLALISGLFSVKGLLALGAGFLGLLAGWHRLKAGSEKRKRQQAEEALRTEKSKRITAEIAAKTAGIQQETARKTAEVDQQQAQKEVRIVQADHAGLGHRLDDLYPGMRQPSPAPGPDDPQD